ncbi:hypothetical protein [uncultured Nostoc sp.]|uniref:hypothetical protein n=1 Tax=uncultured Nostoc sp. TaxID=340711 RepID=UPI0026337EF9|nr:hypothetical protein [uncultured Nostoc sp.]
MKKPIMLIGMCGLLTNMVVGMLPTQAIPASQGKCAFNFVSITPANGFQPIPGLSATVTNYGSTTNAIVHVSADVGIDDAAEVRISYSIDGGVPGEDTYGPGNLANHQQYYEGRAVIAIVPIPSGTHTITPYWRVSGSAGKTAVIDSRCITAELNTQ